jgi:hypothetical protein
MREYERTDAHLMVEEYVRFYLDILFRGNLVVISLVRLAISYRSFFKFYLVAFPKVIRVAIKMDQYIKVIFLLSLEILL